MELEVVFYLVTDNFMAASVYETFPFPHRTAVELGHL